MTKSQTIAKDVVALLKARNPLLWIITQEEARVEGYLIEAAGAAGYKTRTWDVAQGLTEITGEAVSPKDDTKDPGAAMEFVKKQTTLDARYIWIMRDLPVWITGPGSASTLRQLRNLVRLLPGIEPKSAQALVVISPSGDVPPELTNVATVIEWPLPDREEIGQLLDEALEPYEDGQIEKPVNGVRDAAITAAIGLSGEEAQATFAKSIASERRINPILISQEKKRVVTREGVLEWYDPLPGGLDAVGGLENLKTWLIQRSTAYSAKARAYGLPPPKGGLLVGVPGTGKTLTAKATATAWEVPLLKVDLGALKSKFVGESEINLRKAIKVIEAIGRSVVWLDEIEKALQGATSGSADGGVSADALGTILSWMQERQGEAFVIATANDVSNLPPELLRKGRFDDVWWVDLPTESERKAIFSAALRSNGRGKLKVDLAKLALRTEGFTGSEIAALVPEAMFVAFNDKGRELTTADLLSAAENVVPLSETAKEKIDALRKWAKGRARPASAAEATVEVFARKGRTVDL